MVTILHATESPDSVAVRRTLAGFLAALRAGDIETAVEGADPDIVASDADARTELRGRAAFGRHLARVMLDAGGRLDCSLRDADVTVTPDSAQVRAWLHWAPAAGRCRAHAIFDFRRRGDAWLLARQHVSTGAATPR